MSHKHKHHHSGISAQQKADLIARVFPGADGWKQANNLLAWHPNHSMHANRGQYPITEETAKKAQPLLAYVFPGPDGLQALSAAVAAHPNAVVTANALNATGPEPAGPQLEQEAHEAIYELVKLCDADPKATMQIIKDYGETPAKTLEEQVQQVVALSQKHDDFEQKFLADVAKYKGFDIGKIFKAIKKAFQVVGKVFAPIVNAIKKAVAKHKAAKAAQGAGANKPTPPKPKGNGAVTVILIFLGLAAIGGLIWYLTKSDGKADKA